jgi:hypothetical protein
MKTREQLEAEARAAWEAFYIHGGEQLLKLAQWKSEQLTK